MTGLSHATVYIDSYELIDVAALRLTANEHLRAEVERSIRAYHEALGMRIFCGPPTRESHANREPEVLC